MEWGEGKNRDYESMLLCKYLLVFLLYLLLLQFFRIECAPSPWAPNEYKGRRDMDQEHPVHTNRAERSGAE